jgi:hypothetical protein
MTTVCCSISLALLGIAASAGLARGADRPLLVAVEATSRGDIGPDDIREVIAAELAEPVGQVGLHLSSISSSEYAGSFLSTTMGVRLRLP